MAADSAKVDHNMALKGKTFDLVSFRLYIFENSSHTDF